LRLAGGGGDRNKLRSRRPTRTAPPTTAMTRATTILLYAIAAFGASAPALATSAPQVAPRQELVQLLSTHAVHAAPGGPVEGSVSTRRPLTGEPTVLPVLSSLIDNSVDVSGQLWLQVLLPGRVSGRPTPPKSGWIRASNTVLSTTGWHLVVELAARRVLVYRNGRQVRSYPAIVGKPSTPTPTGEYFIEENVKMAAGAPGAPFALATSDRSNVFREFDGGPGEIAIHGLANLAGRLGTAASHGCIRVSTRAITWLAARIAPGTPLTIVG
jgi:lipoprotein-anchoring transpeptidase ErfK/SrfK